MAKDKYDTDEYEEKCVDDFMDDSAEPSDLQVWVRKSPWFAVSGLVHLVLAMIVLIVMVTEPIVDVEPGIIEAVFPDKKPQIIKEIEPEQASEQTIIKEDIPVEDPEIAENPDDSDMSDDQLIMDELRGNPDKMSSADLEKNKTNSDAIGVGGPPGGKLGKRGLGRKGDGKGKSIGSIIETKYAVGSALLWLKRHQNDDGSWDVDGFHNNCEAELGPACDGIGSTVEGDPGVTGLALLAYLGAGHTHNDGSVYEDTVKKGLKYLLSIQDDDGYFTIERASHFYMYGHSIATLAMVEAADLTQIQEVKQSARRGVDVILAVQNDHPTIEGEKWGWRYFPNDGDADSSVTGWMVMALKSAKVVELFYEDDDEAYTKSYEQKFKKSFAGATYWFDYVTDAAYYRAGYQETGSASAVPAEAIDDFRAPEVGTSIAVLSRIFLGQKIRSANIRGGASLLNQDLPTQGDAKAINYYYWYYGTLAMFQVGGEYWKNWNKAMKEAIVDHQEGSESGCGWGSWDPKIAAWGGRGGRVYATALNCLSLEVYYRYARVNK